MGADSKIEWTDHTFNPWWGCSKVSPGCAHCYAESFSKRTGNAVWGEAAPRRFFGDPHWAEPLKWNEAARVAGVQARVFCASMADVFEDRADLDGPRQRLMELIDATPWLHWLLLTKRPENVTRLMKRITNGTFGEVWNFRDHMPNVWLGTTVEDQARADLRIPELLRISASVRFLSCEPLLGEVDLTFPGRCQSLTPYRLRGNFWDYACENACTFKGRESDLVPDPDQTEEESEDSGTRWVCPVCFSDSALVQRDDDDPTIDWVICGGESGGGARPMQALWARSLRDQCQAAGVPFLFKQWGEFDAEGNRVGKKKAGRLLDGRTWDELPMGARVSA